MATLRISKKAKKSITTKLPKPKAPAKKTVAKTRRPSPAAASSPKTRVDRLLATLREQLAVREAGAYQIGKMLIELRDPEIWKLYAETNFKEFLKEQLDLAHSTASRFIKFAESYSEKTALEMGIERGVQLARLAKEKKLGSPEQVWKTNPVLMKSPRKRARELSANELENLTKAAIMEKAKKDRPKATRAEQTALNELVKKWTERMDLDAEFDLDLKKRKILIALDIDPLL